MLSSGKASFSRKTFAFFHPVPHIRAMASAGMLSNSRFVTPACLRFLQISVDKTLSDAVSGRHNILIGYIYDYRNR